MKKLFHTILSVLIADKEIILYKIVEGLLKVSGATRGGQAKTFHRKDPK